MRNEINFTVIEMTAVGKHHNITSICMHICMHFLSLVYIDIYTYFIPNGLNFKEHHKWLMICPTSVLCLTCMHACNSLVLSSLHLHAWEGIRRMHAYACKEINNRNFIALHELNSFYFYMYIDTQYPNKISFDKKKLWICIYIMRRKQIGIWRVPKTARCKHEGVELEDRFNNGGFSFSHRECQYWVLRRLHWLQAWVTTKGNYLAHYTLLLLLLLMSLLFRSLL